MRQRATPVASIEPLEHRRLLTLVMQMQMPDGTGSATVTSVGQTIHMELWGTVVGQNNMGADDGLRQLLGSFLSSNHDGGSALGTLKVTPVAPFDGAGSTGGHSGDLDNDGDLDAGNLHGADGAFVASAGAVDVSGSLLATGQSFKVADVTFTVKALLEGFGASTVVRFVPADGAGAAAWQEDGKPVTPATTAFVQGTVVSLKQNIGAFVGRVFNDRNANGRRDAHEAGIAGVALYIDSNKNRHYDKGEKRTVSQADGGYFFAQLKAGTYRCRTIQPAGYRRTHPIGSFMDVTIGVGDIVYGRNWGETTRAAIVGSVYNDANGDGVRDTGEAGIPGWRVFLDVNNNGAYDSKIDRGFLTNANGDFFIDNLAAPASYILQSVSASAYQFISPSDGILSLALKGGEIHPSVFAVKKLS